ncbi:MAG: hypothetical protein VXZ84_00670 [Planctomycetota bacterium]|nr:hypothetical protein [Planctomycetota bacterium]
MASVNPSTSADSRAMITPFIDGLFGGGLSIVLVVGLIVAKILNPGMQFLQLEIGLLIIFYLNLVINWPHFMASYRILYADQKSIREHSFVSIVMPMGFLLLIAVISGYAFLAGTTQFAESTWITGIKLSLFALMSVQLAWHYTGQSWGMTASYLFIGGFRMEQIESLLIRSGFYALMIFHVLRLFSREEFLQTSFFFGESISAELVAWSNNFFLPFWRVVLLGTIAAGLIGFNRLSERVGQPVPKRSWIPWVATYSWYFMADFLGADLFAIAAIQIFHALQYLSFPLRVELNHFSDSHRESKDKGFQRTIHMTIYYALLVGFGWFAFKEIGDPSGSSSALRIMIAACVVSGINIHHYCIDNVIWKIRKPEVRSALFGHLS